MLKSIRIFALSALVLSVLLTGCTRYANEEELKALEDKQTAARKAETKLADLQKQRRALESRLAEKESELKKAEEEKSAVESRLQ
ncbi:MAG: hypothetical protein R6V47_00225 [Candidatus Delongbacteria bacterium]